MRWMALASLLIVAVWNAGRDGLASMALRLHAPSLSVMLADDLQLRGLAYYRLGNYVEAAEALRLAGPKASFNRGNALARAGHYADAVAAYDAVIARDPVHRAAHANRAIVVKLVDSETERGGGNRPQGQEQGEHNKTENRNQSMTMLEAEQATRERAVQVMRPADSSKAMIADEQWLATMPDEPGRYLKLRIAAEYRRRLEAGIAAPPGDDAW